MSSRVEILSRQLVEHHDKIASADCVFFATHSQGTPVSFLLFSQLISGGVIDAKAQRTGILAMAGISHGPFPQLKGNLVLKYLEQDPARELFDFCDSDSEQSQQFLNAVKHVLTSGGRVVACGSWFDQVVPVSLRFFSRIV